MTRLPRRNPSAISRARRKKHRGHKGTAEELIQLFKQTGLSLHAFSKVVGCSHATLAPYLAKEADPPLYMLNACRWAAQLIGVRICIPQHEIRRVHGIVRSSARVSQ